MKAAEIQEDYLLITDVVLGEVFYVLRLKGYQNYQTAEVLSNVLEQPAFVFDQESMLGLLIKVIAETKLDFADCYLIARAIYAHKPLKTFDKPMQRAYSRYKKLAV